MPLVTGNTAPKNQTTPPGRIPFNLPNISPSAFTVQTSTPSVPSSISSQKSTIAPAASIIAQPKAATPKTTAQTTAAPQTPSAPVLYDSNNPLQLRPGETSAQYLARTQPQSQPQTGSPTGPQTPPAPTFSGLVGNLVQTASQGVPAVQKAIEAQRKLESDIAAKYGQIEGQPIPLEFQQGREQALARQFAAQEQAAQGAVTAATTAQGQQLNALGQAVGAAQPQLGAYGQTYYQPLGGTTGGGGQVQPSDPFYQTLQSYAQLAANGQYSQIPASVTGNAVLNAQLNDMARAINPSYTPLTSQAQGAAQAADIQQTGTTGGQVSKAAVSANQALDALQTAYSQLGPLTGGTGIPFLNQLEQNAALQTGLGRNQVSAYQGALKEARAQIDAVLAPQIGVDAATAQANALLPDNMLPTEIPQKIAAARAYIQQRVGALTSPGAVGGGGSGGGGTIQAGGYTFVQDSSGKWVPK